MAREAREFEESYLVNLEGNEWDEILPFQKGDRIRLQNMPFDREGLHSTGYLVYDKGWWLEYYDPDTDTYQYLR